MSADPDERFNEICPPVDDGYFPEGDPRDDGWIGGYRPGIEGD